MVDRIGGAEPGAQVRGAGPALVSGGCTDDDPVLEQLLAGRNGYAWKFRIPYPFVHFFERLQMSGYLRLMEEAKHRFVDARGISIARLLAEKNWIPAVTPLQGASCWTRRCSRRTSTSSTRVDDIFKNLLYTSRLDCYVVRDGRLVQTATGTITHAYGVVENGNQRPARPVGRRGRPRVPGGARAGVSGSVISGWSAVSPFGVGRQAFTDGVRAGGTAAVAELDPAVWRLPQPRALPGAGLRGARHAGAQGDPVDGPRLRAGGDRRPASSSTPTTSSGTRAATTRRWCSAPRPAAPRACCDLTKDTLLGEKPYHIDTGRIPNALMNSASAQCAIWHQMFGPNATVAGGRVAGLFALQYARRLLESGRAAMVLCGSAEEFTEERAWLEHHGRAPDAVGTVLGEGCGLLTIEPAAAGLEIDRPGLPEVVAVGLGVHGGDDVAESLERCLRRTLERAGIRPADVWATCSAAGAGALGDAERAALAAVLGDGPVPVAGRAALGRRRGGDRHLPDRGGAQPGGDHAGGRRPAGRGHQRGPGRRARLRRAADGPGMTAPVLDAHGIRELLPHRYPILLVDRVLELEPGESIVATKAVSMNEPWYARLGPAPAPADLAYPSMLLIESWAQAAGILANTLRRQDTEQPREADVMLFGSASGVTFGPPVMPGDVLRHRVRLARVMDDAVVVQGDSHVDGAPVLTVTQGVMAFRPADRMPTQLGRSSPPTREGSQS